MQVFVFVGTCCRDDLFYSGGPVCDVRPGACFSACRLGVCGLFGGCVDPLLSPESFNLGSLWKGRKAGWSMAVALGRGSERVSRHRFRMKFVLLLPESMPTHLDYPNITHPKDISTISFLIPRPPYTPLTVLLLDESLIIQLHSHQTRIRHTTTKPPIDAGLDP